MPQAPSPIQADFLPHERKASRNGEVRLALDTIPSSCDDWKVVVDFYEALHWVEAYLKSRHPHLPTRTGHKQRNRDVRAHLSSIWAEYKPLYCASRECRYEPSHVVSAHDLKCSDADVARIRDVVKGRLPST